MNIDEVLASAFNGEPLHDAMMIGIIFVIFHCFYTAIFSGVFSIFKKK